ncbi:magnesium transporter CorA family protein [Aquabacter sp. L1I39]|uniref:magnesium transporter CorA family protein n=1 Tax=Aquabacter sp. L1I39 TaxID=2820278 RepID=UPI001AD9ABE0|nr:magnesium transporter CorA family protein [Aquabacter sp. L1I39]QTL01691.1 magnesium transporter CorA family protein [Aquabacter sp. L1I39]
MLVAYIAQGGALKTQVVGPQDAAPSDAVWLDLVSPVDGEDGRVEAAVGVEIPTREEMQEIEPSSRLYVQDGARYMTLSVLCGAMTDTPSVTPVTFILANGKLVTVRYAEPRAFPLLAQRMQKACPVRVTGEVLLFEFLDTIIDRTADVLEHCAAGIERLSKRVFEREQGGNANKQYRAILTHVGRQEGLTSYARESLSSLSRMLAFLGAEIEDVQAISKEQRSALKSMHRDVAGLADYANFLANKLQFLLDGTIGMVSLEQNNIIKIFAVLSVVLMPPTLIASIYGMNFQHMPELHAAIGYPLALTAMAVSAITPYLFFKWRGWL